MKKLLAAMLLGTMSMSASVMAQDMTPEELFQKLDADTDGFITEAEASVDEKVMEQWSALDANADGKIDPAEIAALQQ